VLGRGAYAADSLGLAVGKTYTTYVDVGRDTCLLVLSASRRDKLREVTWRYPIVGVVPYKGFLQREAGAQRRPRLELRRARRVPAPVGRVLHARLPEHPLFSTAMSRARWSSSRR